MKKVEEKYLLVDDYMLRKVLEKIKEILGIEKYDDINILIDTGDELSDGFTVKMLWY